MTGVGEPHRAWLIPFSALPGTCGALQGERRRFSGHRSRLSRC